MAEKNSLWKNIRKKAEQNRRTGAKPKKPTAEMLRQERKIKAKKYAEGGETDPPYRPLGIPMEGYEPDSVFYETPTRYSEPVNKKEDKPKPTSKRSEVQDYYLNQYLNQNSSTPKPKKYVAERDASSTKLSPAMSTKEWQEGPRSFGPTLNDLDVVTDVMQLGNFVPHPAFQLIGKIGNWGGAAIDSYQAYDDYNEGNYGSMAVNIGSAALGAYLGGKGYRRDMSNTVPGSMADKIANLGSRSGSYRPLTALPKLRNNAVIQKGLNYNRSLLGGLGLETIYDSKADGGYLYAEGDDIFKSNQNQGATVGKTSQDWLANWVQDPEFANRLNRNFPSSAGDLEKKIYGVKEARERASAANLKNINKVIPDIVSDIYDTQFLYNTNPEINTGLLSSYKSRLEDPKSIKALEKNLSTNPQGFTDEQGRIIITNEANTQYGPQSVGVHELIHKVSERDKTLDKLFKGKFQTPSQDRIDVNYDKDEMYPFLMQMRFDNKFQPGEEITPERLKQIRDSGYKNHLFRYYNDDEISKYLNTLASNQTQAPIQYAAQGGYMYPDGGGPTTLYKKAEYDPNTGKILEYAGSQGNEYYVTPNTPQGIDFQRTLPELEIIDEYDSPKDPYGNKMNIASEEGAIRNPNYQSLASGKLDIDPAGQLLLAGAVANPGNLLGELASEVTMVDPTSLVKSVGKNVEKYGKRFLRSNYNPLSIPIKNIGTKIARISDSQYRDSKQILEALKGKSSSNYFGDHGDYGDIIYGPNHRDLNKTYFKGDKTGLKKLEYDTSKDLGLKSSEDWYGKLDAYELNSEIPNNEKLDIIDFLKSMNYYQWNEADGFNTGQYILSKGIKDLMKDYPGENLLDLGKLTGGKKIGLETFNDEQLKVVKDNLRHLFEKYGSNKIPFEVGKPNSSIEGALYPEYKGIQLFGSPIKPIDDIAGHMGFLERNPVTGDINYTTRDVWGFNPKAYSQKYAKNPVTGEKIKPFEKLQIHLMDAFGKPFILHQTNPIKLKDGGHINPYMYYAGGPMYYGDGGKILKHIGAGAYGILEGGLDTLTFGATDQLTDKGFDWLTKVGNKNLDLNDPKNAKFLRTQQQIRGYSNVAGAIGTAAFTGQWGSAIGQSAKGVNTAFQATEGLSDDFKKWSNISSQAIGIGAGLAGGSLNVESASKAGQAAANFGSQVSKYAPYANQGLGMIGGNQQSLLEQAEARQDYLNSPEYLAMKERENQAYVNQGLSFASTGGNINNSLNLQNSMRGKYNNYKRRYSKGGTFQKFGINEIPDSAGYHHENAYGGVPIGPNAMAEGGEFVLDNNYVVSDEVDGMNTQTDEFGRTMAQNLKRDLSKYTMRDLNSKNRDSLRRPMDPLAEQTINQIKQKAMMETEMARAEAQAKEQERQAMVDGALQYAAAGGKLNDDITKIVKEEYAAAYGGYINPKKYKGLNMPYSSGGKLPKEVLRARVESHMSPEQADAYVENYAKGGSIHIKESKKGTFTAAAKKRGKSVQEFARQVLANKGNYSSAMVKKANFARNAAGWKHAQGGPVVSNVNQDFDLYAQNRGGMMMAQGGNFPGIDNDPLLKYENLYDQRMEDLMKFTPDISDLGNDIIDPVDSIQSTIPGYDIQRKNFQNPLNSNITTPGIVGNVESMPLSKDATYLSPFQRYLSNNYPEGLNKLKFLETEDEEGNMFEYGTSFKPVTNNQSAAPDSTTPWYEEPLYSKAARYGQAIPGVIASITALQNKKRKLPYRKLDAQTVNYEPERIIDREESRRRFNTFADRMKNIASNAGMLAGNLRGTLLGSNKELAGRIAESVMREKNTNAQLAQQTAMTQFGADRETDAFNEQMFQNAQTQAIAGLQDTTGKLAGAAGEERKQYLQEWIAKNKLKTRDFIQGPDGSYYYEGPDGTLTKV